MEKDDEPTIRMKNVGGSVRPTGEVLEMRLARIEKLLETINLRLSAMGGSWRPPGEI